MKQHLRDRLSSLRDVATYVRPHLARERARVLLGITLAFGAAGFGVASALVMASVLDVLRNGPPRTTPHDIDWTALLDLNAAGGEISRALSLVIGDAADTQAAILRLGALILGLTSLTILCNVTSRWLWVSVRVRVIAEMQTELFAHLLSLPMSFHVRQRAGTLLSRLHHDIGGVAWMLPVLFHTLLRAPLLLGGSLVVMVRTSLPLTLVTLGTAVGYLFANFVFGRVVRQSFLRQSAARADLLTIAQEALMAIRVVKAFSAEQAEVADMRTRLKELVREEVRGDLYSAQFPAALNQLLSVGAAIIVAVAGLNLVAARQLTEHGMVMFVVASAALLVTSATVAQSVMTAYMMSASAARVLELWSLRPQLADGPRELDSFREALALEDVSFTYGDELVLKNVSLEIRKGDVVAIVGPSGAGKSTLADLLLRLYDPTTGSVRLDGVDVREFTQRSYRRIFGVVSQESLLFNDTIRNNIRYGRPEFHDADIELAAQIANADRFIRQLPQGYDTLVGERGVRLSGGERQRIAIARAIASRPAILIFDEATSALDNESERLVQQAIDGVIRDCTAVIIAHRLSTVQRSDRIVVLDDGRIVESGTHLELLRRDGVYRRLYEAGELEPRPVSAGGVLA